MARQRLDKRTLNVWIFHGTNSSMNEYAAQSAVEEHLAILLGAALVSEQI